jgi:hypothetical protein
MAAHLEIDQAIRHAHADAETGAFQGIFEAVKRENERKNPI